MLQGAQTNRIVRFFESFDLSSDLVVSVVPMKTTHVARDGRTYKNVNGVMYEVKFEKNGFFAMGMLKTTKKNMDNLLIEYATGLFLNPYCSIVPSFVATYGIYKLPGKMTRKLSVDDLRGLTMIDLQGYDWQRQCDEADQCVLLTQKIDKAVTLHTFIDRNKHCRKYIMGMMFQLYYSLYAVRDRFTHYDLHMNNVLVYDFGGPVNFVFTHPDDPEMKKTFSCRFLVKVIDYSRAYFRADNGLSSESLFAQIDETTCKWDRMYQYAKNSFNATHHLKLMGYVMEAVAEQQFGRNEFSVMAETLRNRTVKSQEELLDYFFQYDFNVYANEVATLKADGRTEMVFRKTSVKPTFEDDSDLKTPATVVNSEEEGEHVSAFGSMPGERLDMSSASRSITSNSKKRVPRSSASRSMRSPPTKRVPRSSSSRN